MSKTDFISFFIVFPHNKDETNDRSNQSSDIRKISIQLIKLSLISYLLWRLSELDSKERLSCRWNRIWDSKSIRNTNYLFSYYIVERQDTLVRFNRIILHLGNRISSELVIKRIEERILQIITSIILVIRIDKWMHNRYRNDKLA